MLHTLRVAAITLAAVTGVVHAAQATCGAGNLCPSDTPCCSQYGECGVGAYCLGGCDPEYSHSLDSCMPAPVCKSADYKLDSLDDIASNTKYLGDASEANWVSSGQPVAYNDEAVLLTMAADTVGTLLSSTHYVWYGKISTTMTTSQGAGVVTAFIMMSDVKDEIDFEFVGTDVTAAQSNYYFQGVTDYDNRLDLNVSNTVTNTHTYTIDWQPDYITWAVDGEVQRTKLRNETYNSTSGQYHFPQTPSRIQLSLWPAGLASNGNGTIEWAGGLVDWSSEYMQNGYYYAMIKEVTVECYDPPTGYINDGTKSYYYTTTAGTNDTVAITNNSTILSSLYATGENPTYDPDASSSATGTKTTTKTATATPETVPGVSGAGGASEGSNSDSSNSDTASSVSSAAASASTSSSSSSGFSQGTSSDTTNAGAKVAAGSFVAFIGFLIAAMML